MFKCLHTECDGKMFGKNCEELCGKCFNDEQCDHINGSCMNRCNPGYYGITCTEGTNICSQQAYFFTYLQIQTYLSPFNLTTGKE